MSLLCLGGGQSLPAKVHGGAGGARVGAAAAPQAGGAGAHAGPSGGAQILGPGAPVRPLVGLWVTQVHMAGTGVPVAW